MNYYRYVAIKFGNRNVRFKIISTFAPIEFHSHCGKIIPMPWSEADETCPDDWWRKFVKFHSVLITISDKMLFLNKTKVRNSG